MRALVQGRFLSPKLDRLAGRPREQPQQQQQQPGLAPQSPQEEGHQVVHRPPVWQERERPPWARGQGGVGARCVSPAGFSLLGPGEGVTRLPPLCPGLRAWGLLSQRGVPQRQKPCGFTGSMQTSQRAALSSRSPARQPRVRRRADLPSRERPGGRVARSDPCSTARFHSAWRCPSAQPAEETPTGPRRVYS